ncbi:lipopolysaccharide biosynthesis protein [Caulobacter endophyticus]|uniref:lipopolysaccharide biosynthesis protein n=1 Tax=Caulobacter endophyticus TaxID=2172652 RepID=UPI00240FC477|nr:lipopolysaccharide biosynthesis protein [Caulobacter endophyticus]MDG2531888.1 lipopolysaccharide biosynthesis protein [Caulobacter endophyticus]
MDEHSGAPEASQDSRKPAAKGAQLKPMLAKASLWSLVAALGTQGSTFVIFVILARLLQPRDFGMVAFAALFIDLSRGVMLGGIPEALIQRKIWDDAVANTAFWLNIIASMAFVVVAGLIAGGIVLQSGQLLFPMVFWALSATLLLDAVRSVQEARLRRDFQYKVMAGRAIIAALVGGVVGVACALAGLGVWALVVNRVVTSLVQTVVIWNAAPFRPRFHLTKSEVRPLLGFGASVVASRLVGQMNGRLPDFLIGLVAGPAALGMFRVGSRSLNFLSQTFIVPVQNMTLSAFSRIEGREAMARAYRRFTQLCGLFTFPAFFGGAVIASDFIRLCFGEKWSESAKVMSVLSLAVLATTLMQFFQPAMQSVGRPRSGLKTEFIKLGAGAILVGGLSLLGPFAAAFGDTARRYVSLPESFRMLKRELGLDARTLLGGVTLPLAAASFMALVLVAVRLLLLQDWTPLARLCLMCPLGGLLYAGFLLTAGRHFMRDMVASTRSMLPKPIVRILERLVGPKQMRA